jgi:hypothetical protein
VAVGFGWQLHVFTGDCWQPERMGLDTQRQKANSSTKARDKTKGRVNGVEGERHSRMQHVVVRSKARDKRKGCVWQHTTRPTREQDLGVWVAT